MPLSSEDRIAITELIARYCHATDAGDGQVVAEQFTEDGVLEISGAWQARGRQQIAQIGDFKGKPKHWVSSIVIEGSGSTASATTYYAAVWHGGPLLATGIYESQLTKQFDRQWKFIHHRYTGDPVARNRPAPPRRIDPNALTVEDRVAIIELASRYNRALGARDAAAAAVTFTEDGVLEISGQPEVRGRDALAQMVRELPDDDSCVWATNFIIEGDRQSCVLRAYFAKLRGNAVVSTGKHDDRLTKVHGDWRFVHRRLVLDAKPK
jgi:ketosteroid isomerase-like protein